MANEVKMPGTNPNWRTILQMAPSGSQMVQYVTQFDCVHAFHILAGIHIGNPVTVTEEEHIRQAIKRIQEEVFGELIPALQVLCKKDNYTPRNLATALKEICDGVYVLLGASLCLGLPFDQAFNLVHNSNIQKVKDEVLRSGSGKILSPEGWEKPKIEELVAAGIQAAREFVLANAAANQPLSSTPTEQSPPVPQ